MKFANATKLNRKSGVAEWRDLRFLFWVVTPSVVPWPGATSGMQRLLQDLG